jgi:hypothetical protein
VETLESFIARRQIRMTATRAKENPHMPCVDMAHWRCTLRSNSGARIQVIFSMGSAHGDKAPGAADVLNCLASDAGSVECAENDFAAWCSELGYDTDSRRAERAFKACGRAADKLRRLVGHDFDHLLYETERL